MMSETPLGEILGSDNDPSPEPTEAIAEPPETIGQPRDESGRFAAKDAGEEAIAPPPTSGPPPQDPEPQHIPIAALKDERGKRQQLEAELRQYQEYFAQLQQQTQQQPAPDMFADPDGFATHLREQIRTELMQQMQPTLQQHGTLTRAEVSEMLARQKFDDYDAKIEVFKEALAANPFLYQQLQQAPDPATFAYNAASKYQEARQYGSAAPTRDQIEAELRDKIMAELNLNRPTVPSTLAGDRSVGARSGPAWSGPTPLGDILSR
jgi:hypothetical protein